MLGRSHAIIGAAGFLAVGAPVMAEAGLSVGPAELAAGTLVAAGAALLPDLDHPQATVARAFGPVSFIASRVIAKLAGGHRMGTHSLIGVGVAMVGSIMALGLGGVWGALVLSFICLALLGRLFLEMQGPLASMAIAAVAAVALVAITPSIDWVWVALTMGYVLHLAADAVTEEGVPLLWPSPKRQRLGLMKTGSWRERLVAWVAGAFCLVAVLAAIVAPVWTDTHGPGAPTADRAEQVAYRTTR